MYWKIRKLWKKYPQYFWGDQLDVRYYLCEKIAKLKNKKILDIGCNIGIISGCADQTNKVIGIDINKDTIKIAKQMHPNNKYLKQDLYEYKGEFDIIILANMIDRKNQQKLIKKTLELLKKDGVLYLTSPNGANRYYKNKTTTLPTLAELTNWLEPRFTIEKIKLWNPTSIHIGHLAKFPGAYTLMRILSTLNCKKSVGIYIKARKNG